MPPSLIETLRALLPAAHDACAGGADARVVGERVKVRAVELHDGPAPALLAEVVRRGVAHRIALVDVQAEAGSALAVVVDRCRSACGLDVEAPPAEAPPAFEAIGESGGELELAVLAVKSNAAVCRPLGATSTVTLRTGDLYRLAPGEIAKVRLRKSWRYAGHPYVSGEVEQAALEVGRLGLVPLRLEPRGDWDPVEEYWGEEGEPIAAWATPIIARGPRPAFELEQVVPGAEWDVDPIIDAVELSDSGDHGAARGLLMKLLEQDLRCLDAHAHLGNWAFGHLPDLALRHYEAGLRIGELSLGDGFEGVLPWALLDNRPLLRCMHGYGLSLWRVGRTGDAAALFTRMLWLNPSDNQGARILLAQLERGLTWDEAEEAAP